MDHLAPGVLCNLSLSSNITGNVFSALLSTGFLIKEGGAPEVIEKVCIATKSFHDTYFSFQHRYMHQAIS